MHIGGRRHFGYTVARFPFLIASLHPLLELTRKQMRVAQEVSTGARERLFIRAPINLNGKQSPFIPGAYFALLGQFVGGDCYAA